MGSKVYQSLELEGDSPNFVKDMSIAPSKPPTSRTQADPDSDGGERYVQDIDGFGIAGRIWEAAYILPHYFRSNISDNDDMEFDPPISFHIKDENNVVIELGSGTGYAGLELAATLSPKDVVILTDLAEVCPLLEKNAIEAGLAGRGAEVRIRPLGWGSSRDGEVVLNEALKLGGITHVVCSDVVYFPPLIPLLLRTLLQLTSRRPDEDATIPSVEVIISYKIRSYTFETPFWRAFGAWFEFRPVFLRCRDRSEDDDEQSDDKRWSDWTRFGSLESGDTHDYFVFVGRRRAESHAWPVPGSDEELMTARGDDTFETLLMLDVSG
ncbi:hypothetical protein M407DRAFT_16920 [Tulasnella calospora MUT 4182]|uniref:Uncharacterized protein n=1 Tax=Tulasnella calospora MUT 4182 TaxID=1051891 RepID=A0A0C3QYN1_9AGAM|nr:hypothetical protein M407DRAFT_16920 [Tulasnella calospora MUT 4182]